MTAILYACIGVITLAMMSILVLMFRTKDPLSRAVMADFIFYTMVLIYMIWTIPNDTQIDYEIALLGSLVAGVIPTIAMSRIISKGRR